MGDEDGSDPGLKLDAADLFAHLNAQAGIQVAERLIQEQQIRLFDQRTGDRHTLLLAAGKLARFAVKEVVHMDQFRHFKSSFLPFILGYILDLQRESNVLHHGHMRIKGIVLEDETDTAVSRFHIGHIAVIKPDLTARDRNNARKHIQNGGLTASGRAQKAGQFTGIQYGVEVFNRCCFSKMLREIFKSYFHKITPFFLSNPRGSL